MVADTKVRQLIRHRQPVINNLTRGKIIKGNVLKLLQNSVVPTAKQFTITPEQFSVSSVGYRLNPLAGILAPDGAFAGGTVAMFQVNENDEVIVQNVGGGPFPEITTHLTARLGPFIGPGRIIFAWDIDRYLGHAGGAYAYMQGQISLTTPLTLAGSIA